MTSYRSAFVGLGVGGIDQSKCPVVTSALTLFNNSEFRSTFLAKFGTITGRSVRWIDADDPRRAAKDRPTRPVPEPNSKALSRVLDGDVVDSDRTSSGTASKMESRRRESRYEDTQVFIPRLSEVREGSCKLRVNSSPDDVGILKSLVKAGIAMRV